MAHIKPITALLNLESISFFLYQRNNFKLCSLQIYLIFKLIIKFLPQYGQVGNIIFIPQEQKIDAPRVSMSKMCQYWVQ